MLELNTHIAYSVLREKGNVTRVNTAAPRKNGFLRIETHLSDLNALLGHLSGCRADTTDSKQLARSQLFVHGDEQFELPMFGRRISPKTRRSYSDDAIRATANLPHEVCNCFSDDAGRLPPELEDRFSESSLGQSFAARRGERIIWVKDGRTQVWWPYRLHEATAARVIDAFASVSAGLPLARDLTGLLIELGVLRPRLADIEPKAKLRARLIKGVVPACQLEDVCSYFESIATSGAMRLGDRDSTSRAWMHNERFGRMLGSQLETLVSKLVGYRVGWYFSHFVSYNAGASLPPHRDRVPRAASLSLQLGYMDAGIARPNSWPFSVTPAAGGDATHFLPQLGEAVLFFGHEQTHSRNKIPEGARSNVLLMHFAPCESRGWSL